METDITPIPYVVLVTRIIERCYSDWNHFCLRVRKDGSANSSRLRVALSQFCRHQRELFLKLRTLHSFVRPQVQYALNKLLQDSVTAQQIMPNIINYINQTMWSTRESLLQLGLMSPPSNLSVAVDVLSTASYTRLPVLLDQTVKLAETGDVQLIDYGFSEFDTVKSRLEDEYLITFKRSSVPKDRVKLIYNNGHVDFILEEYFSTSVIYDLTRWQVLDGHLHLAGEMNVQSTGLLKDSFLQLMATSVDTMHKINNNQKIETETQTDDVLTPSTCGNNVFEVIYATGLRYCCKFILEYLYEQALNYKTNSNRVSNVNFTSKNAPIVTCSNVFSGVISLDVEINRIPQCIKNEDYESAQDLFQRINVLNFTFNLDSEIYQFYNNLPFKVSIRGLSEELNAKLMDDYCNKCTKKPFQLHFWINYFYFCLETLMIDLLKDYFNDNLYNLIIKDIDKLNITTLSIYDGSHHMGSLSLGRFTGNILFKVSNNFKSISKLTKKLIISECAISFTCFKSLLHLLIGINKLENCNNPILVNSKKIHPIDNELIIDNLENLFKGRIAQGELKETDAAEALLFDHKCCQISNTVLAIHEINNKIIAIASRDLQDPEIINL